MKKKYVTTILLIVTIGIITMSGKSVRPGILPLPKKCPVICDNDDHRDVYTDEYLLALSSIGEIDLKGIITTYSPNEYQTFVKGRGMIMDLAKMSGMKNLPALFSGTNKKLTWPESNRIEDTRALEIDGSSFIVQQAKKASPKKPLVIIAGGQLTSIANAYLLDPSIAGRIVVMGVFGAQNIDYNAGLDAWAWTIILAKFRTVSIPIGPYGNRGVVYMKPPVVPKQRIKTKLNQSVPFFKWMFDKKHPHNELPNEGDFDGQPAILITKAGYVTQWKRFDCVGINEKGYPILTETKNGKIWQAQDANQQTATNEFWRVMHKLNNQLK